MVGNVRASVGNSLSHNALEASRTRFMGRARGSEVFMYRNTTVSNHRKQHGLGKEHDGDSNVLINGIKNETLRAHADEKTHSSTISSKPSRNPQRVSNSNAISIAGNYTSDPEQPSTTIVSSSLFTTLPPPNNTSAAPKIPNTSAITTIVMDTWITLAPTLTLLPPPEFIVVTPSTFQKSTLTPVPTTMTTTTQASSSSCESRPSHFITLSVIPSNSSLQNQPTEASDYPSPSHLASIEIGFIVFGLVISTLLFSASYAFYGWRRRRLSRQRELNGKNHDAWHGESAACQEGVVALGGHDGLPPELYVPRLGLDKPAELDGLRPLAELAASWQPEMGREERERESSEMRGVLFGADQV